MEKALSFGYAGWAGWGHQGAGIGCNSGNRQTRRLDSYADRLYSTARWRNEGLGDHIVDSFVRTVGAVVGIGAAVALVH